MGTPAEVDRPVKVLGAVGAAGEAAVTGALVGKETNAGEVGVDRTVGVALGAGVVVAATGVQAVTARSKVDATKSRHGAI